MRECITLLIGQAGIQIGDKFWDTIRAEHGIENNGRKNDDQIRNENEILDTMFNEASIENHYVPRTIMIDNDPSVIDQIISNPYGKNLYSTNMMISGKEDAANNFARGFNTLSSKILSPTIDKIRKSVELCESFQSFLMFNSFGGGTGSGFTAHLIDELEMSFTSKFKRLEFNVFPSPALSTAIVEPYNAVFRAHHSLLKSDCMFLFDNEACYDICQRHLNIDQIQYSHINQIISLVASSITSSTRFGGTLNVDLAEYETNLVPYPRIHFPNASYAPILSSCCQSFNQPVKTLTQACFRNENRMIKFDPSNTGKYITCCLLYRGDCTPKQVNEAMIELKKQKKFVKWSPTGMKCGISSEPPKMLEDIGETNRSVCLLSNHTGMIECWRLLCKKFDLMYNKRAFVHWYVSEGMEEAEFQEARDDLQCLIDDYLDIDRSETLSFDINGHFDQDTDELDGKNRIISSIKTRIINHNSSCENGPNN